MPSRQTHTAAAILHARRPFRVAGQNRGELISLPGLEEAGLGPISRHPHCIRIMLESLARNLDGERVTEAHVRELAAWSPQGVRHSEVPFIVSRIVAPDSSGVPLLADLAAMRDAALRAGVAASAIEPSVHVDLVIDHSVAMDRTGTADALAHNMDLEFTRNAERYAFLKWATQAFDAFRIHPPGTGIIHQLNLERLARGVGRHDGVVHFDTLVGTDSHTTMVNDIGVLDWGVGGIEGEAAMLGQPIYLLTPDVVGVELRGQPAEGITATDIVLTIVQRLRAIKVAGKFVEFFGDGVTELTAPDRATIANMAPEYGATAALFPVDGHTLLYLRSVGRTTEELMDLEAYFVAQGMFGTPAVGEIDYTSVVCIDLGAVERSVAGPSRPQDRIALRDMGRRPACPEGNTREFRQRRNSELQDGSVVVAAITSCTNTSNPGAMLAAGLLAKKACEFGLQVPSYVKTSFAPGSRAVSEYLQAVDLQRFLDALGFQVAGYGCATCMGNTGPLNPTVEATLRERGLNASAVLSGNRNFEARIHPAVKSNFLASPPLVIAFALAGRTNIDLEREPVGVARDGRDVFLRDLWPSNAELSALLPSVKDPAHFERAYGKRRSPLWEALPCATGRTFAWNAASTYMQRPPFFDDFTQEPQPLRPLTNARALGIFGDSFTTDHISPGSLIEPDSDAGLYLQSLGVAPSDFSSYVARRANHHVMVRGTFANVRVKNRMAAGREGGWTTHQPFGDEVSIHTAATRYARDGVPTVVFAGKEYGTGSSRDWAAKGSQLLGIRAVIAPSFERIHRSNLIGMGVLPCEFVDGRDVQSLEIDGTESFDLVGIENGVQPRQMIEFAIRRRNGATQRTTLLARIDTAIEATYFTHGGILPFVLRQKIVAADERAASARVSGLA